MSTANRTTAGLLGDLLASEPGERLTTKVLHLRLQRDRAGINEAVSDMNKVGALTVNQDVEDRRRNVVFMTPEQAQAWSADGGASYPLTMRLDVSKTHEKTAAGTVEAAQRRRAGLRFAVWNDGAILIEGLSRKPATLSASAVSELATLFAAFPEGALQALCSSSLRPKFVLVLEGRDHQLSTEDTLQLVDYIEQLPAKVIKAASNASVFAGVQRPGTDHRVHRIGGSGDED